MSDWYWEEWISSGGPIWVFLFKFIFSSSHVLLYFPLKMIICVWSNYYEIASTYQICWEVVRFPRWVTTWINGIFQFFLLRETEANNLGKLDSSEDVGNKQSFDLQLILSTYHVFSQTGHTLSEMNVEQADCRNHERVLWYWLLHCG
jgi:hypothetical protein